MHKTTFTLLVAFFCLVQTQLFAQQDFAEIDKNINVLAKGLYHDLNATKDTLVLKSDSKISYIYSIHNKLKYDINRRVWANDYKVALRDLNKGKHIFVVVQSSLKIVFVVRVFGDEPTIVASSNIPPRED